MSKKTAWVIQCVLICSSVVRGQASVQSGILPTFKSTSMTPRK